MQWQDVVADKSLQDLPYKIELSEQGNIEMSPTSVLHSVLKAEIATVLKRQLGAYVFAGLAIATERGVKVSDVAWGSEAYFQQYRHALCASTAPEICVEILSRSNSTKEMTGKVALYLEYGAIEVWLVSEDGVIRYFNADGQQAQSGFPVVISLMV